MASRTIFCIHELYRATKESKHEKPMIITMIPRPVRLLEPNQRKHKLTSNVFCLLNATTFTRLALSANKIITLDPQYFIE
jgi:hypothetical protein